MLPRALAMALFLAGSVWPVLTPLWSIPFAVCGVLIFWRSGWLTLLFLAGALLTVLTVQQVLDTLVNESHTVAEQPIRVERCWQSTWGTRCLLKSERRTRYYLDWQAADPPIPGAQGLATLVLSPWQASVLPGQSSFALWLLRHRIVARGSVQHFASEPLSVWSAAQTQVRATLRNRPVSDRARGFYEALVMGDRSQLDAEVRGQVARTQTQHLLALSGLHIGSLALWAYVLSGWVWYLYPRGVRQDWQKMAALAMAGLLLWVAIPAVSLWRAFLMTAIPGIAWLLRHQMSFPRLLLLIGCLMVLADPLIWLDLGAWFSWWATLILLLLVQHMRHWPGWRQMLVIQLSLSMLLIPIHALWQLPLFPAGMVLNLILIPWVSFVSLPLAFVTGLGIPGAATLFHWATEVWRYFLAVFDQLWLLQPSLPPLLAVVVGVLAAWGIATRWRTKHWLIWLSLSLALIILSLQSPRYDRHEFGLWILDAGVGQAVVIETQAGRVLVDLGQGMGHHIQLEQSLMRWHLQAPFAQWHTIVVSRLGRHTLGGLSTLAHLLRPPVQTFTAQAPEHWPEQWPRPDFCQGGLHWQLADVHFEFLRPHPSYQPTNLNAGSCVLSVSSSAGRALLLNGITLNSALALWQSGAVMTSDVIISHGRASVGQLPIVTALAPQYWLIQSADDVMLSYPGQWWCTCGRQSISVTFHDRALSLRKYGLHLLPWLQLP